MPNFTFNKEDKNTSFEEVYLVFKHLYGLILKNQFKDALEFFDLMPVGIVGK